MMFPVTLEIVASRRLRAALLFAHLLGAAALPLAGLPWPAVAAGALALAVSLGLGWRRFEAGTLLLRSDGSASWQARGRGAGEYRNGGGATGIAGLIVVRLDRIDGRGRCSLVLASDCADAEALRRLRVWLRWAQPRAGVPMQDE